MIAFAAARARCINSHVRLEIAELQRRQSALRRAEQIARPALIPVRFRHFEAVARLLQHRQLRRRFRRFLVAQQDAIRLVLAAPDAAAQLMQLREPEALRVLDQHDGCIRHIDADFDHRRADERARFAAAEALHDRLLLRRRNAPVQQLATKRTQPLAPTLELRGGRFDVELLALVDQRIDHVSLSSCLQLSAHERQHFTELRVRRARP